MQFMVEGRPKGAPTDEILALMPAETARGKELDAQGLRRALYLAADWSTAWQIYEAGSVEDVQRALESLPLYEWTAYTITPLAEQQ